MGMQVGGIETTMAKVSQKNDSGDDQDNNDKIRFKDWGFNIDRLFEVAYRFYKRNESKAFHPSFDVRNQMNALILQARYGDHDSGRAPDIGVLDFVGKRRQYEWTLLKGMSKREAMSKFICTLDEICPIFKAHAEAVKLSSNLDQPTSNGFDSKNNDHYSMRHLSESKEQLNAIYTSLCRQTYSQFKSYAEKQCPGDTTQQKYLIKSLQDQYFQQYVSQMHPELQESPIISTTSSQDGGESQSANSGNVTSSIPSPSLSSGSQAVPSSNPNVDDKAVQNAPDSENSNPETNNPPSRLTEQQSKPSTESDNRLKNSNPKDIPSEPHSGLLTGLPKRDPELHGSSEMIEADISCEELNASDGVVLDETSNVEGTILETSELRLEESKIENAHSPASSGDHLEPPVSSSSAERELAKIPNHVEHVKLHRNSDFPPIGNFESFPEPRPIQRKDMVARPPIGSLNPNISAEISNMADDMSNLSVRNGQGSHSVNIDIPSLDGPGKNVVPKNELTVQNDSRTPATDTREAAPEEAFERPTASSPMGQPSVAIEQGLDVLQHNQLGQLYQPANSATSPPIIDQALCQADGGMIPPVESQSTVPDTWDCDSSGEEDCEEFLDEQEADYSQTPRQCEEATTWSKKGIAEFKDSLTNDKYGGVYEVKESTMVIIQVPTYPDGRYIYWEFATDDYDIGFGLDFVFEPNLVQPLSLTIYEEEDEEDEEEEVEGGGLYDIEQGSALVSASNGRLGAPLGPEQMERLRAKARRSANTISVLPTYRRDSHEEIFVGRHRYPGKGYYLLKFDNTYSVLRSKSLYFRICYFI